VKKAIGKLNGVLNADVKYSSQIAVVEFDDQLCSLAEIKEAIKKAGYNTETSKEYKFIGIVIIAAAIVLLGINTSGFDMESKLTNASYAVLFVVGILTSIHCVGMCGGIMLSQSIKKESTNKFHAVLPALLYNSGRVISYTILGGIIGSVGSVFSLSITAKAVMQVAAGVFMLMMGFNMAGFSLFRRFNIRLPHIACKAKNKSGSPFIVGLLNGLMPCGPLQTMQLFALGTGSAAKGALAMFVFSIGTVPLMLTFGALSGLLSKGYTKKIFKLSGVLIIVLGLIMANRGFTLAGINLNPVSALTDSSKSLGSNSGSSSNSNVAKATIKDGVQIINMTADNRGYTPNAFYVQKGIPVKWIIDGKQITSCNNAIAAPALNIEKKIKSGENVIEFTPGDKDINFSCWMGMIRGVIKVVDKLDTVDTSKADPSIPSAGAPSCCSGGPVSGATGPSRQYSFIGTDITDVPTSTLINKAVLSGNIQTGKFKVVKNELQPLVMVTGSSSNTKLIFDFSNFDNAEGNYQIVDLLTGKTVSTFTGKKGITEAAFTSNKAEGYAILKGDTILGIIEVTDNLKGTDLEQIRSKYF